MNHQNPKPPRFADRLLRWFCKDELLEEIQGDLYEYYAELQEYAKWKRTVFFWFHVLHFLRPILLKEISGTQKLNQLGMLKLALKTTKRTFFKQKLITSMSLLNLVFGVLCFHLIHVWIKNELSMDSFHQKINQIHLNTVRTNPQADLTPLSLELLFNVNFDQFSEVEKMLKVHVYNEGEIKFKTTDRIFDGKGFVVDSTFFGFFDFPPLSGSIDNILENPKNIVLSEEFARKTFGTSNPIGQIVEIKCDNRGSYQIAAVVNVPSNSSIDFDFLVPRHSQNFWRRIPQEFILTNQFFDLTAFNNKIETLGQNERFPESLLSTIPLREVYFNYPFEANIFSKRGDIQSVYIMVFIAGMILLITVFGFINLQASMQLSNIEKIGIKKLIGASERSFVYEIVVSRLFYLIVCSTLVFVLFNMLFPYYVNAMEVDVEPALFSDFVQILGATGMAVVISIFVGYYQFSKVKTEVAIRDSSSYHKAAKVQRTLTSFQFGIVSILVIVTMVVYNQFYHMTTTQTGFNDENIVSVDFFEILSGNRSDEERKRVNAMHAYVKDRINENPQVEGVSQGDMPIHSIAELTSWKRIGKGFEYTSQNRIVVDPAYVNLLGLSVMEGRFFSDSLDQHGQQKVVINEAAMKYWEIDDFTTTKIASNTSGRREYSFDIIGVVEDFHYEHLSNKINPLVMIYRPNIDDNFLVKVKDGQLSEGINFLEELYLEANPNGVFTYKLLEEEVEAQYSKERRIGKVYLSFTIIALLLSSIGLFTFALHETKRRAKEIGIRKINGASVKNVFTLLSGSFLKSILISFVIACPIAWILMSRWLENFAYRVPIAWWIFVSAGIVALTMAILAVSWQTLKVAQKNPVESLRYE